MFELNFEFQDKNLRYEQKLVKQLLVAHGVPSSTISSYVKSLGDELNFRWFNDEFQSCPLCLESYKLEKPLVLRDFFGKKFTKTEWYKRYLESQNNWPGQKVGLIIDKHGDSIPNLIIHNSDSCLDVEGNYYKMGDIYLQEWSDCLTALCNRWRYT